MQVSNAELSELIGHIYDCALQPERWPATIERIARFVDASVGFIVLHDFRNNLGGRFFDHGIPQPWLDRYFQHYSSENPIAPVTETREVGMVDTLATMFSDDTWESSAFNREWVRAQGLRDVLGMLVLRSGHRGGWLGTLRAESRGDFGEAEVALFRLLSPHVCRAMRISDILDLRSVTSDRFAEVLDALATPVFLLDATQRVVHRNEAAERMEPDGTLAVRNGRLVAADRAGGAALAETLGRAIAGEQALPGAAHALPLGHAAAPARAIATVLPLGWRGNDRAIRPYAAAAAVFVQDAARPSPVPLEAFGALYELTPAELRFLGAMSHAGSIREAAGAIGISEATGKTHLLSIFGKTGVSRQADLVRLILASLPPLSDVGSPQKR
jgi:DNA-binding CsgD family transcriptional regulator/PAS domain-containing protein